MRTAFLSKPVRGRGFSLIEMIIVVMIIGIVSTLGIQSFSSYMEYSRDGARSEHLDGLSHALEEYAKVNGRYPYPDSPKPAYYS
jgi:prepilin-type N-terminal cleavage/methylation domain-containing protein